MGANVDSVDVSLLLLYLSEMIKTFRILWLCKIIVMSYITITSLFKPSGEANDSFFSEYNKYFNIF